VQVAVPTRTDVPAYEDERDEVEALVAAINARHQRTDGSRPLEYTDTSLDEAEVAGWFRAADALVITSLADGMNLVAKEFVASRTDVDGTLILSEFAGAAHDLDGALIVNPYDIEAIKRSLVAAATMPAAERTSRMKTMRASVQLNDVHRWARTFLERVKSSTPVRAVDLGLAGDAADPAASDTVRTIR
jgi:trehalose-6-phosphate synthase